MRLSHRPQSIWKNKPDNSVLTVSPTPTQVYRASKFAEDFHENEEEHFGQIFKYLTSPFERNKTMTLIDLPSQL